MLFVYCFKRISSSFICSADVSYNFVFCILFHFRAHPEQPDVPMNLECRGVSSRSVKLSWKRPFDGNSPMLSYIVQYQPTKFVHAHLSILDSDDHWNSPNTMNITLPNISIGKRYVQFHNGLEARFRIMLLV